MTGSKEAFSELDDNVTGTIIFRCQNDEHRALTDVYYIPQLCSSIISIG